MQAATSFAQALRKTVRCGEVPGFVVNRILTAAMSEVWKATEEEDSIEDGRTWSSRTPARRRWAPTS